MKITISDKQSDLPISSASVRSIVRSFLRQRKVLTSQVSIYFVDQPTICQLHKQFFDDPSPTDCISFPIDGQDPQGILGEIFICPQAAILYTAKHAGDPYEETTLYLIHGLLHLLGYDDLAPADRRKMRAEEKKTLKFLSTKSLKISS